MVEISNQSGSAPYKNLADLLQRQKDARARSGDTQPNGFDVNDTVEISGGGKIVNVARGMDLAAQVREEKDPEKARALIEQGSRDVRRIGQLFLETFKTLFSAFGRGRN